MVICHTLVVVGGGGDVGGSGGAVAPFNPPRESILCSTLPAPPPTANDATRGDRRELSAASNTLQLPPLLLGLARAHS